MLLAVSEIPAAPVLIFMAAGILIAMIGHASKSHNMVLTGLMILFFATAAMFLGAYAAFESDEVDPRPPCGETVKECEKEGESP
jgi:disulfide bond formation protein DsbB